MMTINQLSDAIKWSLEQQAIDPNNSSNKIRVKSVYLYNTNTFVCEFYPYTTTSVDIKGEVSFIMVFLYSFFDDNPLAPSVLKYLAVRGYNNSNDELMYAMSSLQAAGHIARGNALEWLRNSVFQDNSDDFRLGLAKQRISEIENALRKIIIEVLGNKYGSSWWATQVQASIQKDAVKAYTNQTGATSILGEELIYYTFLLQLKTIIVENWSDFSSTFSVQSDFESWVADLNKIRRDEGHNRAISHASLAVLNNLHKNILNCIAVSYPNLVTSYRIANWQRQIRETIIDYADNQVEFDDAPGQNLPDVIQKLELAISQLEDVITKVQSIPIPPGKTTLHAQLLQVLSRLKLSYEEMVRSGRSGNIRDVETAAANNSNARIDMKNFLEAYLLSEL